MNRLRSVQHGCPPYEARPPKGGRGFLATSEAVWSSRHPWWAGYLARQAPFTPAACAG